MKPDVEYEKKKAEQLEEILREIIEANKVFGDKAEFTLHLEGGKYPLCTVSFWRSGDKPALIARYTMYLLKKHKTFQQSEAEEILDRIRSEKERFREYESDGRKTL